MKKKTITGWVYKNANMSKMFYWEGDWLCLGDININKTKGKQAYWDPNEWPPIKVKVTIEVIE
jgi:hypothetical protein